MNDSQQARIKSKRIKSGERKSFLSTKSLAAETNNDQLTAFRRSNFCKENQWCKYSVSVNKTKFNEDCTSA